MDTTRSANLGVKGKAIVALALMVALSLPPATATEENTSRVGGSFSVNDTHVDASPARDLIGGCFDGPLTLTFGWAISDAIGMQVGEVRAATFKAEAYMLDSNGQPTPIALQSGQATSTWASTPQTTNSNDRNRVALTLPTSEAASPQTYLITMLATVVSQIGLATTPIGADAGSFRVVNECTGIGVVVDCLAGPRGDDNLDELIPWVAAGGADGYLDGLVDYAIAAGAQVLPAPTPCGDETWIWGRSVPAGATLGDLTSPLRLRIDGQCTDNGLGGGWKYTINTRAWINSTTFDGDLPPRLMVGRIAFDFDIPPYQAWKNSSLNTAKEGCEIARTAEETRQRANALAWAEENLRDEAATITGRLDYLPDANGPAVRLAGQGTAHVTMAFTQGEDIIGNLVQAWAFNGTWVANTPGCPPACVQVSAYGRSVLS